jgi:hypothetical protein
MITGNLARDICTFEENGLLYFFDGWNHFFVKKET